MAGVDKTVNYGNYYNFYGKNGGLNFFEANQSIAISVLAADDGLTRYDPKYVRMIAKFFYLDEEGNNIYVNIPVHNCTDKEWARFHTPDQDT